MIAATFSLETTVVLYHGRLLRKSFALGATTSNDIDKMTGSSDSKSASERMEGKTWSDRMRIEQIEGGAAAVGVGIGRRRDKRQNKGNKSKEKEEFTPKCAAAGRARLRRFG